MRQEGLGTLKKYNDLIGTRNRVLPACNIAPQLLLGSLIKLNFVLIFLEIVIYSYDRNKFYNRADVDIANLWACGNNKHGS
jgi:hypothetical protein